MDLDDQLADFREKYRREAWRQLLELSNDQKRVQTELVACQAQQQTLGQQLLASQQAQPALQAQIVTIQGQLSQAQNQYQQAQAQLTQAQAQLATTPALRVQYDQAITQRDQALTDLTALRSQYNQLQTETLPELNRLRAMQAQYQEQVGQSQAQLQAQIQNLQQQNLVLQNAQTQLTQQFQLTQQEAQLCKNNQVTQETEFKTALQNLQMKLGQPCSLTDTPEEASRCYQNLSQRYPDLVSVSSLPAVSQGIVTEAECLNRGNGWKYNPASGVCSKRPAPQQCGPDFYYSPIQNRCLPEVVPQQPGVPLAPPPFIPEAAPPLVPGAEQVALHQQHQRECEAAHPEAPQEYYYNELTQQCGHIPTCPENYWYNPELNMCTSNLPPNVQPIRTVQPIPYAAPVIPVAPAFEAPPLAPAFEAPPLAPAFEAPPLAPAFEAPPLTPPFEAPPIAPAVIAPVVQPRAQLTQGDIIRLRGECAQRQLALDTDTGQCIAPPNCGPHGRYVFKTGRCAPLAAALPPRPEAQPAGGLQGFLGQALQQRIGQFTREPSLAPKPGLPRTSSIWE